MWLLLLAVSVRILSIKNISFEKDKYVCSTFEAYILFLGGIIIYLRELTGDQAEDNARSVAFLEAGQQETSEGLLQCHQETYRHGDYGQEDTR